jgi:GntR family transcriptional regulator / MocR family aminotransferase
MTLAIQIDAASAVPVHRQIYEAWRRGILMGRFVAGGRVPSTRELAGTLAISRSTVSQAYDQLVSEGYLEAVRGSGTFVCRELPDRPLRRDRVGGGKPNAARSVRLSMYGSELVEDYPHDGGRPGFVCFSQWEPDRESFPWKLWRRLLARHSRVPGCGLFGYAEQVRGDEALRREIAGYVGRSRGVNCTPSQVLVVNGSQQGLDLCARLLFDRGDNVIVENPGYPGAIRTFKAYGATLKPAAVDRDGIVCRDLADDARVVYMTPSHQYPTGVSMSLNRRLEILAWARRRSAVIIEDDYDSEYRYSGSPLPALQGLAEEVPVIYCGTFSKVMFPGLRIGYLILPEALVPPFTRAKRLADNFTPLLEQMALRDFIAEGHLERHIRRMRRLYGRRREALLASLRRHLGDAAKVYGDDAGMHSFVQITDPTLRERAHRNRVQLRSAQACFLDGNHPHQYLFGFASLSERAIRDGIRRLARQ